MVSPHAGRIGVVLGMLMLGVLVPSMTSNVHPVMVHLGPFDCDGTRTRRRAQHGCGNRAPDRDQNRKQSQQPNPNGSHSEVRLAQRAKLAYLKRSAHASQRSGSHSGKVKAGTSSE